VVGRPQRDLAPDVVIRRQSGSAVGRARPLGRDGFGRVPEVTLVPCAAIGLQIPSFLARSTQEQEAEVREPHVPRVVQRPNGPWVVECRQCVEDRSSSVPIGIGIPLPDKVTAERLAENHRGPRIVVR
jgi:hypothetical protein